MNIRRLVLLAALLTVSGSSLAYEWRSHNRMTFHSRRLAETIDASQELRAFLDSFGESDLDTRAGDTFDAKLPGFGTDEDSTEGTLSLLCLSAGGSSWQGCVYREGTCGFLCTKDHFHPALTTPFAGKDALRHAREYLDIATRLYKAGRCTQGATDSRTYRQWAARALGHAIHLVEDMGSPQHVRPENHGPSLFGGLGKSFHEYWTLDLWDSTKTYTSPDGSSSALVGGFDAASAAAAKPYLGPLESVMTAVATEARAFPFISPYQPGTTLPLKELLHLFAESNLVPSWQGAVGPGGKTFWTFWQFDVNSYPVYGHALPHDGRHTHLLEPGFPLTDYLEVGPMSPPDEGSITVQSFQLAERSWAERDPLRPETPVDFDTHLRTLLEHTTDAAAGAILAFWDEVKDYRCPCSDFTRCSFPTGSKNPDCSGHKGGPYPPGRDFPDDTQGVVATTSAVTTPAVSDLSSPDLVTHWQAIASVGVEKGLPSLVDFGRTMYLLSLSQDAHLTDAGRDTIARGMAELEAKYSVHIRRPEDDLPKAAHVAVLFNGFAGEAAASLDALGWTHVRVDSTFDPLQLAEDQAVLLVPSGGLYGTSGSPDLQARLTAYVQAGGTLVVMAQMRGEDFATVPVPDGETLHGFGWFEDQSCWAGSVTIAAAHPLTAALTDAHRDVNVDGFLDRWPQQSTLLLRKSIGGMPVLFDPRPNDPRSPSSRSRVTFSDSVLPTRRPQLTVLDNPWARVTMPSQSRC